MFNCADNRIVGIKLLIDLKYLKPIKRVKPLIIKKNYECLSAKMD
jgi:hypothetical protein